MKPYRLSARAAAAAGICVTIAAIVCFWSSTHSFTQSAFVVCPGVAFTLMLMLGSGNVLERLQHWIDMQPARVMLVPAGLWLLYVVYAVGMNIAGGTAVITMAVYLTVPSVAFWPVRNMAGRLWLEPLVILWIWLPLELGIVRRILITTPGADLHYAFAQLLAIDAGVVAFAVWDRMSYIGYHLEALSHAGAVCWDFPVHGVAGGVPFSWLDSELDRTCDREYEGQLDRCGGDLWGGAFE